MEAILNIGSNFDDLPARELSNFQPRPFVLDGVPARSVEGLLQGMKFPPGDPRREETFHMAGIKAKRMGDQAENQWAWWGEERIPYGSEQHQAFLERAIRASFEQNPWAMLILCSTRGMKLTHDLGPSDVPDPCLPADRFCAILTKLRDETEEAVSRRQYEELLGRVPILTIDDMQAAAKLIEVDGHEAFRTVCERYGRQTARLLLTAHLRRHQGSMDGHPPDPAIDNKVKNLLRVLVCER